MPNVVWLPPHSLEVTHGPNAINQRLHEGTPLLVLYRNGELQKLCAVLEVKLQPLLQAMLDSDDMQAPSALKPFEVDHRYSEIQDVMQRFVMIAGDHLEVRVHRFMGVSDTAVHNHANEFCTFLMAGSYMHENYNIDSVGSHNEWIREAGAAAPEAGSEPAPVEKPGKVQLVGLHRLAAGDHMFLTTKAFHQIVEPRQAVTFAIRCKHPSHAAATAAEESPAAASAAGSSFDTAATTGTSHIADSASAADAESTSTSNTARFMHPPGTSADDENTMPALAITIKWDMAWDKRKKKQHRAALQGYCTHVLEWLQESG